MAAVAWIRGVASGARAPMEYIRRRMVLTVDSWRRSTVVLYGCEKLSFQMMFKDFKLGGLSQSSLSIVRLACIVTRWGHSACSPGEPGLQVTGTNQDRVIPYKK
jgi:hypothetical protein